MIENNRTFFDDYELYVTFIATSLRICLSIYRCVEMGNSILIKLFAIFLIITI